MDIKAQIEQLRGELIALRRDFHMHPEIGLGEHRTSQIIYDYLESCGLEVSRMAGTGIVALLRGVRPGKTLIIRADIDAIPVTEANDLPYKSTNPGLMHACGHDGHASMLMVAAKILARNRGQIYGNVKFVFQPNEEDAGAYLMVEEGVMDNPKVDAAVSMHLWTPLESGRIDIFPGPVMAASHYFHLTVKGKGGHAGFVHRSVDPIICATDIVQSVQAVQTRETSPLDPSLIVFCKITAGSSPTIVPDKVEMEGSIRFLHHGGEEVKQRFERIVAGVCATHRCEYELGYKVGNRMLVNDPDMAEMLRNVARQVVPAPCVTSAERTMVGDNFCDFSNLVPGAYFFLGTGNSSKGTDYPHHHPMFNIDEDVLPLGVEMHVRTALEYLK